LPRGLSGENWVLDKPEEIVRLERDFVEAGADIILTCTFSASPCAWKAESWRDAPWRSTRRL